MKWQRDCGARCERAEYKLQTSSFLVLNGFTSLVLELVSSQEHPDSSWVQSFCCVFDCDSLLIRPSTTSTVGRSDRLLLWDIAPVSTAPWGLSGSHFVPEEEEEEACGGEDKAQRFISGWNAISDQVLCHLPNDAHLKVSPLCPNFSY